MTTTEIALLSTCIGSGAGILTQIIANALRDKTDREKTIFDLIAEERKLAHMILLNRKSYDESGVTIEYYYQLAVISPKSKEADSHIEKHHEEIKVSNSLHAQFCILISDYCKNIYKLILYIKESNDLEKILLKIMNHSPEDVTGIFNEYKTYPKLFEVYSKKHISTSINLKEYTFLFNEMRQNIERIKNTK